ncbi:hypothetical protein [Georgenia sp. H159]|uniref:hypothetical protein n=1 Tax=Georgenia sp. H159 TaxID=3076115 RepID=UPI002D791AA7|nr:hypothetical protein [Georgenia sp. H159]
MSARTRLVADLKANLPAGYRVTGSALMPSGITRPTVAVWQQSIQRREEFGPTRVAVGLEVWLLVGPQDPERADDELDDALEDVLAALQPVTWVQWTEASRGVLGDAFHGYNIQVTAVATISEPEGA